MEFTCDECFQMRQKTIAICPRCGKKALESRVVGCSSLVKCTNCGMQAASAGGFFESCHEDENMYLLRVYEPGDNSRLVKLARILNRNALELKKQFNDGRIDLQYTVMECLEKKGLIIAAGIKCELDDEIEKVYPRIIGCPYAIGVYEEWPEFDEKTEKEYNSMFEWFIEFFPDDKEWFDNKCEETQAFPEDGMHIVFGMVIVPYILEVAIHNKKKMEIAFDFIERMEVFGNAQIAEVIEYSVLENLIGVAKEKLDVCVSYMGSETKEAFKTLVYKNDV